MDDKDKTDKKPSAAPTLKAPDEASIARPSSPVCYSAQFPEYFAGRDVSSGDGADFDN
jgi:hypothetical protein